MDMLRSTLVAIAVFAAGSAGAQEPGADASGIDFMLRPTEDPNDTFWIEQLQPGEPALTGEIGPPLFGPDGDEPIGPPLAGPAVPEPEPRERRIVEEEDDPFAPVGIALGTFIIRPSIEIGVALTDNPAGTEDKEFAAGLIVAPEIEVTRDGSRFDLEANAVAEAIFYGEEEFDDREAEARLLARYDLTSQTELEAELGYSYELDRFTDPNTPDLAVERPPVHEFDAALGATQRLGRLSVGLTGEVERSVYEDVELQGGLIASRKELDNTDYGLRLRAGYEVSPSFAPFVETAVGRRDFDQQVDDNGFERSSVWGELRGGLIIDRGEKLSGEVSIGYRREDIDDPALDDLDGVVAEAAILWSPRRLTEIRFGLSTEVQPTSLADSSGSILYTGELTFTRRVNSRLRLETGAEIERETFEGIDEDDVTYTGFAGLTYAFNRSTSLRARYTYEQTESDDPGGDTTENSVSIRVRIQR